MGSPSTVLNPEPEFHKQHSLSALCLLGVPRMRTVQKPAGVGWKTQSQEHRSWEFNSQESQLLLSSQQLVSPSLCPGTLSPTAPSWARHGAEGETLRRKEPPGAPTSRTPRSRGHPASPQLLFGSARLLLTTSTSSNSWEPRAKAVFMASPGMERALSRRTQRPQAQPHLLGTPTPARGDGAGASDGHVAPAVRERGQAERPGRA